MLCTSTGIDGGFWLPFLGFRSLPATHSGWVGDVSVFRLCLRVCTCVCTIGNQEKLSPPPWGGRCRRKITATAAYPWLCRHQMLPKGWMCSCSGQSKHVGLFSIVVSVVYMARKLKTTTTTIVRWWLPTCATVGHHKGGFMCVFIY